MMNHLPPIMKKYFALSALVYIVAIIMFLPIFNRNPHPSNILICIIMAHWINRFILLRIFNSFKKEFGNKYHIIHADIVNSFAKRFKTKESIIGGLFITAKGLHFIPFEYSPQKSEVFIDFSDIVTVSTCKLLWIFNTGLLIETKDGKEHKYTIWGFRDMTSWFRKSTSWASKIRWHMSK
jgi:hypothetical protein